MDDYINNDNKAPHSNADKCKICKRRKENGPTYTINDFLEHYALIYGTPEADFIPTACKSCISEVKLHLNIDELTSITKIDLEFRCSKCKAKFPNKAFLLKHKKESSCARIDLTCAICYSIYNNKKNLEDHKLEHRYECLYKCPMCSSFIRDHDRVKVLHEEKYCSFSGMEIPKVNLVKPIENVNNLEIGVDPLDVTSLISDSLKTEFRPEELILKDENIEDSNMGLNNSIPASTNGENYYTQQTQANKRLKIASKTIKTNSSSFLSNNSTPIVAIPPVLIPVHNIDPLSTPITINSTELIQEQILRRYVPILPANGARNSKQMQSTQLLILTSNNSDNTTSRKSEDAKRKQSPPKMTELSGQNKSTTNYKVLENVKRRKSNIQNTDNQINTTNTVKNAIKGEKVARLSAICRRVNRDPKKKHNKTVQTNSITDKYELDEDKLELIELFEKSNQPASDIVIMHDIGIQIDSETITS